MTASSFKISKPALPNLSTN